MLCEVGQISTYLRPVNTSRPVMLALAWPCLPVLDTEMEMTLHGLPFRHTKWPLRISPARTGMVLEAPAADEAIDKSRSSVASSVTAALAFFFAADGSTL